MDFKPPKIKKINQEIGNDKIYPYSISVIRNIFICFVQNEIKIE